jgi:hypothetical protein
VIAPGSTVSIDCEVEPIGPGPFNAQLDMYVDDDGLQEIAFSVQGEGSESKKR